MCHTCPHTDFHVTHIEMYGDILAGRCLQNVDRLAMIIVEYVKTSELRLSVVGPVVSCHVMSYYV